MGGSGANSGMKGLSNEERKRLMKIKETVKSFADKRRGSKIEYGWRISTDGEFEAEFRGGKKSVLIHNAIDKITVHWHPDGEWGHAGGTFSVQDLRAIVWRNEPISYVVDRDRIYWLKPQYWFKGNKINDTPFADAFSKARDIADKKSMEIRDKMMKQGKFDRADGSVDLKKAWRYESQLFHNMRMNWLKNNAKKFGWEFGWNYIKE